MGDFDIDFSCNSLFGKSKKEDRKPKDPELEADVTASGLKKQTLCNRCGQTIEAVGYRRRANNIYRKAFGELKLNEVLPKVFNADDVIHVISGGDVDSFSYIQFMLKLQPIKHLILSTWCMAKDDIAALGENLKNGRIGWLDVYVGEISPGSYPEDYALMAGVLKGTPGRLAVFRNHAKVYAAKGRDYDFIIESSANVNTNPRAENATITIGPEGYWFYKAYFDGIISFARDFDDWKPYAE